MVEATDVTPDDMKEKYSFLTPFIEEGKF